MLLLWVLLAELLLKTYMKFRLCHKAWLRSHAKHFKCQHKKSTKTDYQPRIDIHGTLHSLFLSDEFLWQSH